MKNKEDTLRMAQEDSAKGRFLELWGEGKMAGERVPDPKEAVVPVFGRPNGGSGLIKKAVAIYKTRWYEKSVVTLKDSISKYDKNWEAYWWLACSLAKTDGPPDERLNAYAKCLEINSNHADANFNLGVMLLEKHDINGAEDKFRQAIALNPNVRFLLLSFFSRFPNAAL